MGRVESGAVKEGKMMSLKAKQDSFPVGTRFLYKALGGSTIFEDTILEWSPSALFVKLQNAGWKSVDDIFHFNVLEKLEPYQSIDIDMCPNCVTPWKCNGPHRPTKKNNPYPF